LNKAGTAIRTYPSTVRLKNCQSTSILLVGLGSHSPLVASSSNSEPKLEILLKVQGPKGADFYECSAILAANTALAILRGNESTAISEGGVLTPALCAGNTLIQALEADNFKFRIVTRKGYKRPLLEKRAY